MTSDAPVSAPPPFPAGFRAHVANDGVKDDTDDLAVVTADRPVAAAAVFTRSRFAGPSVELSRHHAADHRAANGLGAVAVTASCLTGAERKCRCKQCCNP